MSTGWRSARESRRPHTRQKLQGKHRKHRVSKARRKSVENSMRALRMKGLLPGGDSVGSRRRPAPQAEGEEREHDDTQR